MVKFEAPPFGEAAGMLGSILGGSHAYKSLDVVLQQKRGNARKTRKVFENEEKMNDKRWKWADLEKKKSVSLVAFSISLTLFLHLNDRGLPVFSMHRSTSLSFLVGFLLRMLS